MTPETTAKMIVILTAVLIIAVVLVCLWLFFRTETDDNFTRLCKSIDKKHKEEYDND